MVERLGGETFLYTQLASGEMMVVQADGEIPTPTHESIAVKLNPATCHLFDGTVSRSSARSGIRLLTCGEQRRAGPAEKSALYPVRQSGLCGSARKLAGIVFRAPAQSKPGQTSTKVRIAGAVLQPSRVAGHSSRRKPELNGASVHLSIATPIEVNGL